MLIKLAHALERAHAEHASYDEKTKKRFHKAAKAFFKKLADQLGLKKGDYTLSTNPGGIAILGDTTLHTNNWYLSAGEGLFGEPYRMLVRTVTHQKDYTGGPNQWLTPSQIANEPDRYRKVN